MSWPFSTAPEMSGRDSSVKVRQQLHLLLLICRDWHLLPPLCLHQQGRVGLWSSLCRVRGGPKWACWVDHSEQRSFLIKKKPRKINSFVLCVGCLLEGRFD